MKVVLSMIVKNEAHVLRRALESAKPFVDEFCIVDTGSTDGTPDIALAIEHPCVVHHRDWVDFGHNRQEALELARPMGDYVLFLDADDVLEGPEDFQWPELTLPGYNLHIHYDSINYTRCALVQSSAPWRWEAPIHEYLTSDVPLLQGVLDQPRIKILGGGARSKNPMKFMEDVGVLLGALAKDPGNARHIFYLAQSYKDAGDPASALMWYRKRAQMNGWVEENWYAHYMVARLTEHTERDGVAKAYLNAYQVRPVRAEPLYHLAQFHRKRGEFALAYLYAKHGATIPLPEDRLFLDASIYQWRTKEELALAAYYTGHKDEGHMVMKNLLAGPLPDDARQRLQENMRWYE